MEVRNRKSKGSSFEYDVLESINQKYPNSYLTKQRGFQLQYDIQNDRYKFVIECKFHRTISWNEAEKLFNKLVDKKPDKYKPYLIFKTNRQPVLVMYQCKHGLLHISKFEELFEVPFVKHKPIRKKR